MSLPGAGFNPMAHSVYVGRQDVGGATEPSNPGAPPDYNEDYGIPNVSNPEKTYASITKREYLDWVKNFGAFEEETIGRLKDTSLVDEAPGLAKKQFEISRGTRERNLERYGTELTGAQRSEMGRASQRGESLAIAGTTNNARIAQIESNNRLRANLANIAQGVYGGAIEGMGSAAQNAQARMAEYQSAKAAARAQNTQLAGSLASAAIMAIAFSGSDIRLKEAIEYLGKSSKGYNIYTWNWNDEAKELGIDDPTTGVIAQEIQEIKPEAVRVGSHGYLMVNYGAL